MGDVHAHTHTHTHTHTHHTHTTHTHTHTHTPAVGHTLLFWHETPALKQTSRHEDPAKG